MSQFQPGHIVVAVARVIECEGEEESEVHALPGDFGAVIDVCDGWPNVRFARTDSVTICSDSELRLPYPQELEPLFAVQSRRK